MVPGVGLRPYVPDHKVYFAAFDNKRAACYLCGLLNTPMVKEWVESHIVSIQVGNIFKHLKLPDFDSKNPLHLELVKLVEKAHREHDGEKRAVTLNGIGRVGEKLLKEWIAAGNRSAKSRV